MAKKNYRPKKTFTPKTEVSKKPKVSCLIFKEGMTFKGSCRRAWNFSKRLIR